VPEELRLPVCGVSQPEVSPSSNATETVRMIVIRFMMSPDEKDHDRA